MADTTSTQRDEVRLTLATRLGTAGDWGGSQDRQTGDASRPALRVSDAAAGALPERVDDDRGTGGAKKPRPSVAELQSGIAAAEARARRLGAEIERARRGIVLALEAAAELEALDASRRWRLHPSTLLGLLRRRESTEAASEEDLGPMVAEASLAHERAGGRAVRDHRVVVALAVLAVVGLGAWKAGALWSSKVENVILDSGFEEPALRWYAAGLQTQLARREAIGRSGSAALEVRTEGDADGEGPAYTEIASVRPGPRYTFSAYSRSFVGAVVYPEIRWKARDGRLVEASRGPPVPLGEAWTRLAVTGSAPAGATSALLVVGEAAGSPEPVTYLVEDAQFERASTAGAYASTSGERGVVPGHLTDAAAVLMLVLAGLLAVLALRLVVLLAIPLSLLLPPSITSLGTALPDLTPTAALVIASLVVLIGRRQLRLPPLTVVFPAVAYVAAVGFAFVLEPSIRSGGQALAITLGAWAPALLVLGVARRRADLWLLLSGLTIVAAAAAGLAMLEAASGQYLLDEVPGLVFRMLERAGAIRTQATFPHPIILGTFLALTAPLALALALQRRWLWRACGLLGLAVILGGLATTLSRGPWIGAAVALTTFLVVSRVRRRWLYVATGVAAVAAAAVLPFTAPVRDAASGVVERSDWNDRYIVDFRLQQARELVAYASANPLSAHLDARARPSLPGVVEGREVEHAATLDSIYGNELIQTGVLGLAALMALLLVVVGETIRSMRRAAGEARLLGSALLAAEVAALLAGLFSNVLGFAQVGTAFWLVGGAGIALRWLTENGRPDDDLAAA